MSKKLYIIIGVVFLALVLGGGWWIYINKAVVPEQVKQASTPSFPEDVNQSNQEAVLVALKNLNTAENYTYYGSSYPSTTLKGFTSYPIVHSSGVVRVTGLAVSPSIKLAVNGSRGPLVLKAPATINVQAWIDPMASLSDCELTTPGKYYHQPIKVGELILETINSLMPLKYPSGGQDIPIVHHLVYLECQNKTAGESVAGAIEVWVFE